MLLPFGPHARDTADFGLHHFTDLNPYRSPLASPAPAGRRSAKSGPAESAGWLVLAAVAVPALLMGAFAWLALATGWFHDVWIWVVMAAGIGCGLACLARLSLSARSRLALACLYIPGMWLGLIVVLFWTLMLARGY